MSLENPEENSGFFLRASARARSPNLFFPQLIHRQLLRSAALICLRQSAREALRARADAQAQKEIEGCQNRLSNRQKLLDNDIRLTAFITLEGLMWTVFLSVCSALLAIVSATLAWRAARYAAHAAASAQASTSLPESRLQSLIALTQEHSELLENLANRIKMMKVRSAASHTDRSQAADALPDPYRDPDGWRNAMNQRLARAKFPTTQN